MGLQLCSSSFSMSAALQFLHCCCCNNPAFTNATGCSELSTFPPLGSVQPSRATPCSLVVMESSQQGFKTHLMMWPLHQPLPPTTNLLLIYHLLCFLLFLIRSSPLKSFQLNRHLPSTSSVLAASVSPRPSRRVPSNPETRLSSGPVHMIFRLAGP